MAYQPIITKNRYDFGEVASALQKCIRRGLEKEAMFWALELDEGFSAYLWRRLCTIAVEDIGMANPDLVHAVLAIAARVEDTKKRKGGGYEMNHLGYVIIAMSRSPKSREADEIFHEVARERRLGVRLQVPDFAKDMHTAAGKRAGKGITDFWTEGAKIENEAFPSQYTPWNEDGCAGADGKGRILPAEFHHQPSADQEGQLSLFFADGQNQEIAA